MTQKTGKQILCIKKFLLEDLWRIELSSLSRARGFIIQQVQVVYLVINGFVEQKCLLRASALTYSTLLSIVPLLALIFSLAKGFGVQNRLKPFVIHNLTAGMYDIAVKIIEYVDNTDVKALGGAGLAVLLFSVINVLGNIESSFNDIWGITKQRTLFRKFSDYTSVIIVGPVLLMAAAGITASLSSTVIAQKLMEFGMLKETFRFALTAAPYISLWIAFTCIYIFMPNTEVNFLSALIGGITGGSLWQFSQWIYIHFQIVVSKYNTIYGTFASFPVFIVWLYMSWAIVLLGAQVSFAHQNADIYSHGKIWPKNISYSATEILGLMIAGSICRNFYFEKEKKTAKDLSKELNIPVRLTNELLDQMCHIGIITEASVSNNSYFLPSRSPEHIKIKDILNGFKRYGEISDNIAKSENNRFIYDILDKIERAQNNAAGEVNLKDIVSLSST